MQLTGGFRSVLEKYKSIVKDDPIASKKAFEDLPGQLAKMKLSDDA